MNEMQNELKIISSDLNTTQRQFVEEIITDHQQYGTKDCLLQTEFEHSMLAKHQVSVCI